MNDPSNHDHMYKILLLGDPMVGKTCFLMRYTDNNFVENSITTVGLDYKIKFVKLQNEKILKLQLWDTAGQDKFKSITQNYYKGAHGIILMYDITCIRSFNNIRNWIISIKNSSDVNVKILLIGNKIDCTDLREVPKQDGEKLAKEYNIIFFEVSAKTNTNIDDAILQICSTIYNADKYKNYSDNKNSKKLHIFKDKKGNTKRKCCK